MSKVVLHVAVCALVSPLSLYAMGLGDMRVSSSLNQPFHAEISLLDLGNSLLDNIKVDSASEEEYGRVGFDRSYAVSLLEYKLTKNARGKMVVEITSKERMVEPFLDILVDLSWPTGQIFKQYIVLLDPQDYALNAKDICRVKASYSSYVYKPPVNPSNIGLQVQQKGDSGAVVQDEHSKERTYGPVAAEETIWQIAQHYKIPELKLSQLILAIVGSNPDAFTDGNLNGLKKGVKLIIPSANQVAKVPANLSSEEVAAHDLAWKEHQAINHIIAPPYFTEILPSEISPVGLQTNNSKSEPSSIDGESTIENLSSAIKKITENNNTNKPEQVELNGNTQTLAALQALQASNAVLNNQLSALANQNQLLQKQLDKRDQDIAEIREQLKQLITERQAVAAQVQSINESEKSDSSWIFWLFVLAATSGGIFVAWRNQDQLKAYYEQIRNRFSHRQQKQFFEDVVSSDNPPSIEVEEPARPEQEQVDEEVIPPVVAVPLEEVKTALIEPEPKSSEALVEEQQDSTVEPEKVVEPDNSLEFEPGLYTQPEESAEEVIIESPKPRGPLELELHQDLDNNSDDSFTDNRQTDLDQGLLKNNQALDTLLDLAKTYVSMGDFEAARQSLDEVISFGNPEQKKLAEDLLNNIPK